jgi:hypothetical protein
VRDRVVPGEQMRRVSTGWIDERTRLHDAFVTAFGVPDVFWLSHLGTPLQRWSDEDVRDLWAGFRSRGDAQNNVYLHVPFCKSICSFCNYDRLRPSNPAYLERWQARVLRSIEIVAPGLRHHTFHAIYVGGGTPSVLPAESVRTVMGALDRLLTFHPDNSRYFEMDPAVMSEPRMAAWRDAGFRNTSFGVQTLSADVNSHHNRGAQGRELVAKRFRELREHGMTRIACDFLLGLADTEPDAIAAEIEEVLAEHRPESIDVYQLTPTPAYVQSHFGGDEQAFWAHVSRFVPLVRDTMPKLALRYGYEVIGGESGHRTSLVRTTARHVTAPTSRAGQLAWRTSQWVPDRVWNRFATTPRVSGRVAGARYSYQQTVPEQRGPLSTLGLGPSARSRLFGHGRLEYRDPDDDPDAEGPAWWIRQPGDLTMEACTFALLTLRDGDRLDRPTFRRIFIRDIDAWFPEGVAALVQLDRARLDADTLTLLDPDRRSRARDLMWLVPTERLEFKLAEQRGLSLTEEGLREHLGDLGPGSTLVGRLLLAEVSDHRLVLAHGAHRVKVRVAPALEADQQTRLVVESAVPADPEVQSDLRRAFAILRKRLTPTGGVRRIGTGAFIKPGRPTSM